MQQRIHGSLISTLVALAALGACTNEATTPASLALTGLAVIDVETGAVTPNQTILVDGGVIRSVGSAAAAAAEIGVSTTVVDHTGHFAIPGLWDMHVHFRTGPTPDIPRDQMAAENRTLLPQYVGFGVTGVRDAGGDQPEEVLRWRGEILAGTLVGPRIFTALRKISGVPPAEGEQSVSSQGAIHVASVEEMQSAIDSQIAAGADFIKIHDEWIAPDVYLAGLTAAQAHGVLSAAHVPRAMPLDDALATGIDSLEHLEPLLKAAQRDDRTLSGEYRAAVAAGAAGASLQWIQRAVEGVDEQAARAVFREMNERQIAASPTLVALRVFYGISDADAHEGDARLQHIPPGIRSSYLRRVAGAFARRPEQVENQLRTFDLVKRLVGIAASEGVTVLAGSDSGPGNSFVYPGDSLHAELTQLVEAGLSPLQALQAATINGARWFRIDDRFGTLAPGKMADLVILTGNPLDDIAETRSIVGVVLNGRHFDDAELETLRALPQAQ